MTKYSSNFKVGDFVNYMHGTTVHEITLIEQSPAWPDTFYARLRSLDSGRHSRVGTNALRRFYA